MVSFRRSKTPYTSIYPFNEKQLMSETSTTSTTRKPGSRKPRVIVDRKYVSNIISKKDTIVESIRLEQINRSTVINGTYVEPKVREFKGFAHLLNK